MRYENSFRTITAFVISFHLLCIGWCIWSGTTPPVKKIHEKLVVKTISLKKNSTASFSAPKPIRAPEPEPEPIAMAEPLPTQEPYVEAELEPEVEPEPAPKPLEKPKPEPKKEVKPKDKPKKEAPPKPKEEPKKEKKPDPKKETKPVSKTPPKKEPKEEKKVVAKKTPSTEKKPQVSKEELKKQELISKAQALFAKAGTNSSKKSSNDSKLITLGTIGKLEIDNAGAISDVERRYQDILASHLKDRLRFPDYGEVKIKLTLEKSGKVLKVEVVSSKSEENRNYAVKTLPGILFPSFNTFIKEDKYTFSVTLKND